MFLAVAVAEEGLAAASSGARAARAESLTAMPGRIHGVALWWSRDTSPGVLMQSTTTRARGSVEPWHKPVRRACPVERVFGEALDQPRFLALRLEVDEHGEQRGRGEAERGVGKRPAKSDQDRAPVHRVTHEPEDSSLAQARAGARSRQGRERTSQREDAEDGEERAREGNQQPENAQERFQR